MGVLTFPMCVYVLTKRKHLFLVQIQFSPLKVCDWCLLCQGQILPKGRIGIGVGDGFRNTEGVLCWEIENWGIDQGFGVFVDC